MCALNYANTSKYQREIIVRKNMHIQLTSRVEKEVK